MAELKEDTGIYPVMTALVECLGVALEEAGAETPSFIGVLPGAQVAFDFCGAEGCGGQVWVRLANAFPSLQFPLPLSTEARCGSPLAYILEVGIVRCAATPDGFSASPPGPLAQLEVVRKVTADMEIMRKAIQCCVKGQERPHALGNYTPTADSGGCVGGVWTVTIGQYEE